MTPPGLELRLLGRPARRQALNLWVPRRIFGPRRSELMGDWRKLQNEELHNLYSSPDINRKIKCRRMRWAGHIARLGRREKHVRF
jgi:hypothetical protein